MPVGKQSQSILTDYFLGCLNWSLHDNLLECLIVVFGGRLRTGLTVLPPECTKLMINDGPMANVFHPDTFEEC